MSRSRAGGFTLIELVVTLAISSLVVVFVAMFLAAPLGAFEAQSRRNQMVGDLTAAWPRMHDDLREALPNSVRVRVNGSYVALEMLKVVGVTRYTSPLNGSTFDAAGTTNGVFKGPQMQPNPLASVDYFFAVNPGPTVYALGSSMVRTPVQWTTTVTGVNNLGSGVVTLGAPPAFAFSSPRSRAYLVSGPITYLCDLRAAQRTLRRYEGYSLATNHTSRDAPNEFPAGTSTLIARGITACAFRASPQTQTANAQTVSVRLTSTLNGDTMTLLHEARPEYVP